MNPLMKQLLLLWLPMIITSSLINTFKTSPTVIVGGGPIGLSAALFLEKIGFQDITVIEKRNCNSFESEKAYLYLLDSRGQKLTDELGITAKIASKAVSSRQFTNLTEILVDGKLRIKQLPTLFKTKKEKYWIPRSVILDTMLVEIRQKSNIKMMFNTSIESIKYSSDSKMVMLNTSDGTNNLSAQFVIGCDGYQSTVRQFLSSHHRMNDPSTTKLDSHLDFVPKKLNSDSAGLKYKMLTPKTGFPLPGCRTPSVPGFAYAIRSSGTTPLTKFSLGLLPVFDDSPRTANIIAVPQHKIWSLQNVQEVKEFMEKSFPQLSPLSDYFDDEEIERFFKASSGEFPKPSYITRNFGMFEGSCIALAGDAVHFFPPDLGQGVNSGLEDVYTLVKCIQDSEANSLVGDQTSGCAVDSSAVIMKNALTEYQKKRVAEAAALAKLMTYGYPYQYQQNNIKGKLCLLNFALRLALNKIAPFIFHPPAFFMVQNDDPLLSYVEINKRAHRTTRAIAKTFLVASSLIAWNVFKVIRSKSALPLM